MQEIKTLINDLKSLQTKGVSLIGGEVFLRPDWKEIVHYVTKNGMFCAIITNGYLLSVDIINILKEEGVIQLGISLDAACDDIQYQIRRKKGSFNKAIKALELSLEHKIPVTSVITSVNKLNINELENIFELLSAYNKPLDWQIKLCSNHNADRFASELIIDQNDYWNIAQFISHKKDFVKKNKLKLTVSEAHDLGYYSETFSNISQDWMGCLAGIKTIGIQSNGNVKGCLALPDKFIEGNIKTESIVTIWNDPDRFQYTRNFSKDNLDGECKKCAKSDFCRGGCIDFSYSLSKKMFTTPFCLYQMEQMRFLRDPFIS